ncbi:hypothetical protein KCTC32516_00472 [Polaribacter huanghezhanensis]|uniref:hypothetical protein n=1 Tax=Polaribacter huanghezhanensis TaxID=1354726 RepID=UPI002648CA18|nr:hypothetical protein [Polaribacter huanghezhanensis]WKD85133.1 hypothetical protein KCTC32516_00472 [Polaribacter huanghezhanensis]
MKKLFIVIAILTASFTQAQQEVKLDIFDALVLKTIEVSYEKYIDETSSFGISGFINFEKNSADFKYNEKRVITPYFRHYFTFDNNWNFFGEGFFAFNFGEKEIPMLGGPSTYEDYTDGALGIAVGLKYVSEGGFTVDVYGGAGRNLFSINSPIVVPRLGVNIGWRL